MHTPVTLDMGKGEQTEPSGQAWLGEQSAMQYPPGTVGWHRYPIPQSASKVQGEPITAFTTPASLEASPAVPASSMLPASDISPASDMLDGSSGGSCVTAPAQPPPAHKRPIPQIPRKIDRYRISTRPQYSLYARISSKKCVEEQKMRRYLSTFPRLT